MGGDCVGVGVVVETWEREQWSGCRACVCYDAEQHLCEVLDGRERTTRCDGLDMHLRAEGVRLYGVQRPRAV